MPSPLKRLAGEIHQRIDRVERHRPELRKGQVTDTDPLRVDGVRASNLTGFALTADDVVWMLVGNGRRQIFAVAGGVTSPDGTKWRITVDNSGSVSAEEA